MLTDGLRLTDQHCHGVVDADLDRPAFERLLTEADVVPAWRSAVDSMIGLAVRRWCAPVLDLPPHASTEDYLTRRADLGWQEASRRLLGAAGTSTWLVDTGLSGVTTLEEFGDLSGGRVCQVLRLEAVAEEVAASGVSADRWASTVEQALRSQARGAAGLKSVLAYRTGLGLPATSPTPVEVRAAASGWLADRGRLTDPVLLAWLVHLGARVGAELGLPLQLHTGFGDTDLRLHRADPALLADFLAATMGTGVLVVLLHCWPYHRNAGYLAQVFPHVLVDVGLTIPQVGERAGAVLAELLELAPFGSVVFSSDGYGLPELHHLGALLWRRGLGRLLDSWLAEDVLTAVDAEALAVAMATGNSTRAYRLASATG